MVKLESTLYLIHSQQFVGWYAKCSATYCFTELVNLNVLTKSIQVSSLSHLSAQSLTDSVK